MAAETMRITEELIVEDKTGPGLSSADAKVSAFDRTLQNTQSRLRSMSGSRWDVSVSTIDKATSVISAAEAKISSLTGSVWDVTVGAVDKASGVIKNIGSKLSELLGIGAAVTSVIGGITVADMLSASSTQMTVEKQLSTVLANVSEADDAMDRLEAKASSLQQTTIYGDEAYLAGAAELATYMSYYSLLKSFNISTSCDIMLPGDENGKQVCYHSRTKGRN